MQIKTYTVNYIDEEFYDCQVPCSYTKYTTEVSYSKFPDHGTTEMMIVEGYYDYVQYQRQKLLKTKQNKKMDLRWNKEL